MKGKPLLIALGIAVIITGAFAYIYLANPEDGQVHKQPPPSSQQTQTPKGVSSSPGAYTDYTENSVAST